MRAVQKDADERWRNRMDKEDRITLNTVETFRFDVTRISAKQSEEVICMKSIYQEERRQHGIRAAGETFAVLVLHWTRPNN